MISKDKHLNYQLEEKHHGESMERGGLALRLLVVLKAGKLVESRAKAVESPMHPETVVWIRCPCGKATSYMQLVCGGLGTMGCTMTARAPLGKG